MKLTDWRFIWLSNNALDLFQTNRRDLFVFSGAEDTKVHKAQHFKIISEQVMPFTMGRVKKDMKQHKILQLTIAMQFGDIQSVVYPTLLWDEQNIILIDCGFIGALPILEKELLRNGLSARELTGLVLTHHDHDHMGAAAALKRINPAIKIFCSPVEAPFISAQSKPLRLSQAEKMQSTLPPEQQSFGEAFCEMLRRVEPIQADCFLNDQEHLDWCGGCRVIATPGHTPGHISLLMENDSIMITGDAMALEGSIPVIANPQYTLDIEQATISMEKLLSMKANSYYCYHGGVYSSTDSFRDTSTRGWQ